MNRLKEERGAALLLVLVIILIFSLLGLAVMSASIGGAVRSETKQKDVQSVHLAEKALNEAVAMIQGTLQQQQTINIELIKGNLKDVINLIQDRDREISNEYEDQYHVKPVVTTEVVMTDHEPYKIDISVTATIDGVKRKLQQQIIINSFPGILKYAAGSEEGNLVLNGSSYFLGGDTTVGGLYAGNQLLIKNQAEYNYKGNDLQEQTTFPGLVGTAYVESLNKILYCEGSSCVNGNGYLDVKDSSGDGSRKDVKSILGDTSVTQLKNKKDFFGVNLTDSFLDKLNEAIGGGEDEWKLMKQRLNDGQASGISDLMNYVKSFAQTGLYVAPVVPVEDPNLPHGAFNENYNNYLKDQQIFKAIVNSELGNISILHKGDFNLNNSDYSHLLYKRDDTAGVEDELKNQKEGKTYRQKIADSGYYKSNWFIIDGDLNIINNSSDPVDVRANLLVTGNVNISGYIRMDATIYALGETNIVDASIEGLNGKELVLMCKGKILITRVNTNGDGSFRSIPSDPSYKIETNPQSGTINRLDAFFYTDSTAELYGVGSVFWIKGGFFSKGSLTINAVRGDTGVSAVGDVEYIHSSELTQTDGRRSRFIIYYNSDIFKNQSAALPRVKTYSLLRGKKMMVQ